MGLKTFPLCTQFFETWISNKKSLKESFSFPCAFNRHVMPIKTIGGEINCYQEIAMVAHK